MGRVLEGLWALLFEGFSHPPYVSLHSTCPFCSRNTHFDTPHVPLPSQSEYKNAKQNDAVKLIPVCSSDSGEAKDFKGTQWKYAQFHTSIIGADGSITTAFLPDSWLRKEAGVNVRVKVRGTKVARKIVIEFTAVLDSKPLHRAYLEFHALDQVTDYKTGGFSINETFGKDTRKPTSELRDGYILVCSVTNGGIGFGLDFDAPFLSDANRQLLFARNRARNFSMDSKAHMTVAFHLNARWVDYTSEDSKTKRKRDEAQRV